jgi:hypothetical protein
MRLVSFFTISNYSMKVKHMSAPYSGLIAAALVALILTLASAFFLGKRGPWGSIWTFFLVLFLTLTTVSIYISPIGPVYWGIAWIPITIAGMIITILLIAAMPHPGQTTTNKEASEDVIKNKRQGSRVGSFFWLLIVLFAIAIMVGMMNPQKAL